MRLRYAFALTLMSACTPQNPSSASIQWFTQLRPLLADNSLLAERVLVTASGVHNGTAPPATVQKEWEDVIVPLARHLHDQAAIVQPAGEWVEPHTRLTTLWGNRADGYELAVEALRTGDDDRWRRGKALADQAKLGEEAWFKEIAPRLAKEGINLDQFP